MTRTKLSAKRTWRQADAVCFDVDSTLIVEEGIDELAEFCGAGALVREWTKKAMGGGVTFQEALKARLDLIHPTLLQLEEFNNSKRPEDVFTPGIRRLVALLKSRGTAVYLVSGGFRSFIEPLADFLGIPRGNIYANRILFSEQGKYIGFDEAEPTSRSGGKPRVLGQLKMKYNKIVMIGDGMTDMEASPPADAFIGFGGNVVREKVKAGAPWYVYRIQELIDELERGEPAIKNPPFCGRDAVSGVTSLGTTPPTLAN